MERWRWMLAFVVVASACGGGDSGGAIATTGESGNAVTSGPADNPVELASGTASLSLAPGSLPEGVPLDDVQVMVLVDEAAEPGAPVVAVQLLPEGLVLTEPATLTVSLPATLESGLMAIHQSGDSIEFVDGEIQQDDDGVSSFLTPITHFSRFLIYEAPVFVTSVSWTPEQVSVGQTQTAQATITANDTVSLWFSFEADGPGTARLLEFSLQRPVVFSGNAVIWTVLGSSGPWDPFVRRELQ